MRKRSRSSQETDDPRAIEPARGERESEGSGGPEPKKAQDAPPGGPRRRKPRRSAAKDSAQGTLFDETPPPSSAGEDQSEAKMSRSKRRRERRKAVKSSDPGTQRSAASDVPRARESAQTRPKAAPRHPSVKSASKKEGAHPERRASLPPSRGSGSRGPSSRSRSDDRRPSGARRHGHPDGLPPLSLEDLDAIPRNVSNVRGHGRPAPAKAPDAVRRLETLSPSSESIAALTALEGVLDEAVPLQARHRASLGSDIRKLWEELTSDREFRSADYLGSPPALSAYLRYFLPWNVFRLAALLTNADFCLPDKAVIVDMGSGPLTLPIALWIARPELRDVPLTIYCVDRVERVLEAGVNVFQTLCMRVEGRLPPWRLEPRKDSFGVPLPERAHLLTAANVFNEFFWKDKRNLGERALATARTLLSYLKENGSLFVMEPGDPRSGAFISALRAALLAEGAPPLGPCPHAFSCPMPGIFRHLLPPEETRTIKGDPNVAPSRFVLPSVVMPKKRDKFPWCHFGIDAFKAPAWLEALSEEAGLPKERAVLSYLWAARGTIARSPVGVPDPVRSADHERRARAGKGVLVRVISEPFALPDGSTGQYACSSLGYTLLKRPRGEESFGSGDLLEVTSSPSKRNDEKSGAIILPT